MGAAASTLEAAADSVEIAAVADRTRLRRETGGVGAVFGREAVLITDDGHEVLTTSPSS